MEDIYSFCVTNHLEMHASFAFGERYEWITLRGCFKGSKAQVRNAKKLARKVLNKYVEDLVLECVKHTNSEPVRMDSVWTHDLQYNLEQEHIQEQMNAEHRAWEEKHHLLTSYLKRINDAIEHSKTYLT